MASLDSGAVKFLDAPSLLALAAANKFTNVEISRYQTSSKSIAAEYAEGALSARKPTAVSTGKGAQPNGIVLHIKCYELS